MSRAHVLQYVQGPRFTYLYVQGQRFNYFICPGPAWNRTYPTPATGRLSSRRCTVHVLCTARTPFFVLYSTVQYNRVYCVLCNARTPLIVQHILVLYSTGSMAVKRTFCSLVHSSVNCLVMKYESYQLLSLYRAP